jgi:hypothetical protein
MALPTLETPENKGQVQEIISDIATAVFKSAKISMESAAKAVVPSVPEMVNEVLDDLKSGSIQKFNLAMDKLDKLVRTLGIDLKQYNKELANFAARREEKITKSEEKIQLLKEKNIVAEIEKSGDIKILSNREIENKKNDLKLLEKNIAKLEKSLEKDRKLLQESDKLKTRAQANKKEEVKQNILKLDNMKKERETEKQILGERGEKQPGIFQRGRERVGSFVDEYVPDPIADIGSTMVEGFMAPINAVKDLGKSFGQLLKPLKALKPLFTGLLGSLKKFALGLKASVVAMLPQIAIAGLIVLALGGLYLMLKKAQEFFGKDDKTGLEDYGEDMYLNDPSSVAKEGDMSSKVMRRSIVDQETKEIIQPNDPRYDEIYERDRGVPAPKKGEVFVDGERKILPLTDDGQLIKSGNFMNPENRSAENLKTPDNLKPIDTTSTGNTTSVIDTSNKIVTSNSTYTGTGLNGSRDRDLEIFHMAHPLYSA